MKIVIMDGSAANPGDLSWDDISKLGDLTPYETTLQSQVVERACDAEIVLTNKTAFTKETIEKLPNLKYIGVMATGYNVVDLDYCREKGIIVTNVPEYSTFATAQMTIALLLELCDQAGLHDRAVKDGEWVRAEQFCFFKSTITELWNKKLHIFGFGKIGKRVAEIASALGMEVTATPHTITSEGYTLSNGSFVKYVSFEEGIKNCDVVSLHSPLTEETREIICKSSLEKFKDGAMLINCARGPLINEQDVADALVSGKLSGFAADVVKVEPMLPDNPLLNAPNCVLTPHIAWAPKETRARLIKIVADNIEAFINGNPINVVN